MEGVNIRAYQDKDLSALVPIFNSARTSAGCFPEKEVQKAGLQALIEGEAILVAEVEGAVRGFVSVWVPDQFIHHLYVSPDHQSRGIGNALIKACKAQFGLPLSLKCNQGNTKALAYYQHQGWIKVGEGMGDDGPWDELWLSC